MAQAKKRSILEVVCNTLTGLITAYLTWNLVVIPFANSANWDMNVLVWWQVTIFNFLFTTVSILRGYFWRRLFNKGD